MRTFKEFLGEAVESSREDNELVHEGDGLYRAPDGKLWKLRKYGDEFEGTGKPSEDDEFEGTGKYARPRIEDDEFEGTGKYSRDSDGKLWRMRR